MYSLGCYNVPQAHPDGFGSRSTYYHSQEGRSSTLVKSIPTKLTPRAENEVIRLSSSPVREGQPQISHITNIVLGPPSARRNGSEHAKTTKLSKSSPPLICSAAASLLRPQQTCRNFLIVPSSLRNHPKIIIPHTSSPVSPPALDDLAVVKSISKKQLLIPQSFLEENPSGIAETSGRQSPTLSPWISSTAQSETKTLENSPGSLSSVQNQLIISNENADVHISSCFTHFQSPTLDNETHASLLATSSTLCSPLVSSEGHLSTIRTLEFQSTTSCDDQRAGDVNCDHLSVSYFEEAQNTSQAIDDVQISVENSLFMKEDSLFMKEDSLFMKEDSLFMKEDSLFMKEDSLFMKEDSLFMKEDSLFMKEDSLSMKEDSLFMKEDSGLNCPGFNTQQPVDPGTVFGSRIFMNDGNQTNGPVNDEDNFNLVDSQSSEYKEIYFDNFSAVLPSFINSEPELNTTIVLAPLSEDKETYSEEADYRNLSHLPEPLKSILKTTTKYPLTPRRSIYETLSFYFGYYWKDSKETNSRKVEENVVRTKTNDDCSTRGDDELSDGGYFSDTKPEDDGRIPAVVQAVRRVSFAEPMVSGVHSYLGDRKRKRANTDM